MPMPTISQEKKQILNRSLGVSKRLSDALDKTEAKVGKLITKASRDPKISQQAIRRTSLFDKVLEEYSKTAREMAEELGIELEEQNKSSAKATAKKIPNAKPHKLSEDQKVTALDGKNVSQLVAVSTGNMSANAIAKLRKAVVKVMNEKALEGLTADEVQKRLQEEWDKLARNKKGFRFVDARGVAWENSRYLQMLVRTTMSTIARNAEINTLVKNGRDIAMISEDGGGDGDCEVCARWEGKMVSLTGATKGFPTLADAQSDGLFHPNCVHRIEYVDDDEIEDYMKKHGIKKPRKKKATTSKKPSTSKKTGTKKTKTTTEETTTQPKRTRKSKVADDSQFLEPIRDNSFKGEYKGNSSSRKARSSFLDVNNNEGVNAKDIFDNDVEYTNEDVKNIRELKSKIVGESSRLIENHIEAIRPSFIKKINESVDVIYADETLNGSYSKIFSNGERVMFLDTSKADGKHPLTFTHEGSHLIWWHENPASLKTDNLIQKEQDIKKTAQKEAQAFLNTFTKEELEAMKFDNRSENDKISRKQDAKTCEIIGKKLGLTDEQIKEKQVQLSNIADTLLCATNGKYGFGHDKIYTSSQKDCVNEVIAQTMNSELTKDNLVGKVFKETQEQVIKG